MGILILIYSIPSCMNMTDSSADYIRGRQWKLRSEPQQQVFLGAQSWDELCDKFHDRR